MSCYSLIVTGSMLLSTLGSSSHLAAQTQDLDLARSVLQELGADIPGSTQRCSQCHGMSAAQIATWGSTMRSTKACVNNMSVGWYQRLSCLFKDTANPNLGYHAKRLGLWSARPQTPDLVALFRQAYPTNFDVSFRWFLDTTQMPRHGDNQMSEDSFAKLNTWVDKGMPHLYQLLPKPPGIERCQDSQSPSLKEHINRMHEQGWAARNQERLIQMAGCYDSNPLNCFTQTDSQGRPQYVDAKIDNLSSGWANQSVTANYRILVKNITLFFWLRSSADGRFIGTTGQIYDIGTFPHRIINLPNTNLDPNFMPDSTGFSYLNKVEKPVFCPYYLLQDTSIATLNLDRYPCRTYSDMDAYLYFGSSLDGRTQLAISGTHVNDDGTKGIDPSAYFSRTAVMTATVLGNSGSFERVSTHSIATPGIGDWALSQSGQLAAGRVSDSGSWNSHQGYRLKILTSGTGVSASDAGTVCLRGAKVTFSYDERFMVTHHHVVSDEFQEFGYNTAYDPEFQRMVARGTSNIYLVDLLTGSKHRLTTMQPGQRALFPHFRSDGWLYFAVADTSAKLNYVVATDAAIRLQ